MGPASGPADIQQFSALLIEKWENLNPAGNEGGCGVFNAVHDGDDSPFLHWFS